MHSSAAPAAKRCRQCVSGALPLSELGLDRRRLPQVRLDRRLHFVQASNEILVGCRTGLVLALITMVTSEMIARQAGLGNILFNALDMAQYDTVYAMIVIVGVLGFVLDAGFERLRARLVAWAAPSHAIIAGTA